MGTTNFPRTALALLLSLACAACADRGVDKPSFVTDYGLGPDKWATAWLLTRHVDAGAGLSVVEPGAPLPPGIAFDVPGSELTRSSDRAAFHVVLEHFAIEDPVLRGMAQVVHDIEVDFWNPEKTAAAPLVEQAYRILQVRHGRESVPPECYLAFFDRVHAALVAERSGGSMRIEDMAVDCAEVPATASRSRPLVAEVRIERLLRAMRDGKRVVFVDVREPGEYLEGHIPGALNIPLRNIDEDVVAQLSGADYVVSYCVKDFRGFEMARALQDAGVENSVILSPYGIRGWVASGLPTVGTRALAAEEGAAAMARCVAGDCGSSAM